MRSCTWLELVARDKSFLWAPYECAGDENKQGCNGEPQGCEFSRHGDLQG